MFEYQEVDRRKADDILSSKYNNVQHREFK